MCVHPLMHCDHSAGVQGSTCHSTVMMPIQVASHYHRHWGGEPEESEVLARVVVEFWRLREGESFWGGLWQPILSWDSFRPMIYEASSSMDMLEFQDDGIFGVDLQHMGLLEGEEVQMFGWLEAHEVWEHWEVLHLEHVEVG